MDSEPAVAVFCYLNEVWARVASRHKGRPSSSNQVARPLTGVSISKETRTPFTSRSPDIATFLHLTEVTCVAVH